VQTRHCAAATASVVSNTEAEEKLQRGTFLCADEQLGKASVPTPEQQKAALDQDARNAGGHDIHTIVRSTNLFIHKSLGVLEHCCVCCRLRSMQP
jgi:hypothetical protein